MENTKQEHCEEKGCGKLITKNMAWYTLRQFGFKLCYEHQQPYKLRKFRQNITN